jgi:hypothetical protein
MAYNYARIPTGIAYVGGTTFFGMYEGASFCCPTDHKDINKVDVFDSREVVPALFDLAAVAICGTIGASIGFGVGMATVGLTNDLIFGHD